LTLAKARRGALLAASLVTAAWLAWVHETRFPLRGLSDAPQPLLVAPGDSVGTIGEKLHALGLVSHPLLFRAFVHLRHEGSRLRAGEYSLDGPLSLADVVEMLVRGDVVHRDVTFPEGQTLDQMAATAAAHGLDGAAFLAAAGDAHLIRDLDKDASDLEGYLFPDTYDVPNTGDKGAESRRLVARMVERFREMIAPELARLTDRGLSVREVVTLASLVERETAQPEERPRIAGVFLNRLKLGMPLQTDPTVIYALRKAGSYDGNIHKKDLSVDSPYNTYKHAGLPPGPIASPGREALRAVLEPSDTKDLYFVSRNDGTHEFSASLRDHERAVDRYQRRRSAARGDVKG
jgi:peptidoglycan lytic transglycosylase G